MEKNLGRKYDELVVDSGEDVRVTQNPIVLICLIPILLI